MKSKTKQWLGGTLFLLLIGVSCLALLGWKARDLTDRMAQSMPTSMKSEALFADLQLSKEQKSKIEALETNYHQNVKECCQRHCSARMKIAHMFQAGATDAAAMSALQREMSEAQHATDELTMQHILAVSQLLTPEQRAQFLKKFGDAVAATCPLEFLQ